MNQIIICSTNVLEFNLPGDPGEYKDLLISFRQGGRLLMQKHKADLSFEERTDCVGRTNQVARLTLTPQETLAFSDRQLLFVQVRRLRSDGVQDSGEIHEVDVLDVLDRTPM